MPLSVDEYLSLCDRLHQEGDRGGAERIVDLALRIAPGDPDLHAKRASLDSSFESGPDGLPTIRIEDVREAVRGGVFEEARILLRHVLDYGDGTEGLEEVALDAALTALTDPLPSTADAGIAEAFRLVRVGEFEGADALFKLRVRMPGWAAERVNHYRWLRSRVNAWASDDGPAGGRREVRAATRAAASAGDLKNARHLLADHIEKDFADAGASETLGALGRLVSLTEGEGASPAAGGATVPMTPIQQIGLHLSMGNFDLARAVVDKRLAHGDAGFQPISDDLRTLAFFIEPGQDNESSRTTSPAEAEPYGPRRWSSAPQLWDQEADQTIRESRDTERELPAASEAKAPALLAATTENTYSSNWLDDPSTTVLSPENEAELLVKNGYLERALALYKTLAAAEPSVPRYALRVKELSQRVERRAPPKLGPAHTPPDGMRKVSVSRISVVQSEDDE